MHLRADDGIRTRDPHLGKVMRYQLRYIRAQRTRSSPGAKHDDSPPERDRTNFSAPTVASPLNVGQHVLREGLRVLIFDVVRLRHRSRSSVEERPPHTREVAGSNPAGTTSGIIAIRHSFLQSRTSPRFKQPATGYCIRISRTRSVADGANPWPVHPG
jgi:hypothetical protein